MKTAAIICEYNPLHNGHKYHIEETKRLLGVDAVVAVMSGNFVQRGDAAIYDKITRANAAVMCGADLVVEIPTVCAVQTAECFARNAVYIANSIETVEYLSFGAENPNVDLIREVAALLCSEPPEFSEIIKKSQKSGETYAASRSKAVRCIMGSEAADFLALPNNILAVEYQKALLKSGSGIKAVAVKRNGVGHDSGFADGRYASASYIRGKAEHSGIKSLREYIPGECFEMFCASRRHSAKNAEKALIANIIKMSAEELGNISDVSEGLENRLKKAASEAKSLEDVIAAAKTKRYSESRLRRIILSAYLGITKADRQALPPYIKVLAHSESGKKIIAANRSTSLKTENAKSLPLARNTSQINKLKNASLKKFWEREKCFDSLFDVLF